jgi:hypothetical protein
MCRYVSTAAQRTQHGARCPLASICVWTARRTTVTWVSISPSCDQRTSTVRYPSTSESSELLEQALIQDSLAMGSTAHLQDGRQRKRDQILPITRRFCCTGEQRPQGQIHQQCGDQVQGGTHTAMCCGRQAVCRSNLEHPETGCMLTYEQLSQ